MKKLILLMLLCYQMADGQACKPFSKFKNSDQLYQCAKVDSQITAAVNARMPAGVIVMWSGLTSAIPSGWHLCDGSSGTPDLRGKFILSVSHGANPGDSGGAMSVSYTPAGTISQPTLTMDSYTPAGTNSGTHTHSVTSNVAVANHSYTPAGTNSAPTLTMDSYTPAGTNSGTHTHSVTSNVTGTITASGSISWPANVPTNASGAFAEGAISWPANPPTNASGAFTEGAISWPVNPPTINQPNISATGTKFTTSGSGTAALTAFNGTTIASGANTLNNPAQTISYPVNVPTIAAGSFTQPTISYPVNVPTIAAGTFTQPTISWPVNPPTFAGTSNQSVTQVNNAVTSGNNSANPSFTGTAAVLTGTNSAPTFTGTAATLTHSITNNAVTSGVNSANETFTGTAHVLTGTVSDPTFTGTPATIATEPRFFVLAYIMKL